MRMLHTMIRVGDLDRSITFYTEVLGMKLLRRKDYPGGKFTLAFVGYGDEAGHTVLELTHNWDTDSYDLGTGYGHIALAVEDAAAACDAGGKFYGSGYHNESLSNSGARALSFFQLRRRHAGVA